LGRKIRVKFGFSPISSVKLGSSSSTARRTVAFSALLQIMRDVAGGDLAEDVAILYLQTAKLLDELVLLEVKLELGLDPVVEQAVSMWCVELRDVV
jgi:hypothetical protein